MVVFPGPRSVEHESDESADGSLPLERMGVDDVNSRIGTVAQVILAAIRVDPADIERSKRIAGDENARNAFGFGIGRSSWTTARIRQRPSCYRRYGCDRETGKESQSGLI